MDRRAFSFSGRESPVERFKPSKLAGRLRSACDSCHQAKVKCSGESPCSTCQASQLRCVYSPASRQGRPKGSKNKRTLVQEGNGKGIELHEHQNSSDALGGKEPGRLQQQQPKSMSAGYNLDLEHEFDTTSVADHYLGGDPDLLLSPNMGSFLDSTSTDSYLEYGLNTTFAEHLSTRVHPSSIDDSNAFFAQISAELAQTPYTESASETLDSSNCDSGDATGTASPFSRTSNLSSPRTSISPGHRSRLSGSAKTLRLHHCSCLQQQAQLVYKLDDLEKSHAKCATIDSVLRGVQLARDTWENLIQCSQCQSQIEQKEVFLLFAMSIRTLLSLLQKSNAADIGISVGSYELSGKTKAEVINLLFREALQSITSALLHLQERAGRPRRLPPADLRSSSSNSAWEAPNSILLSTSTEPQMQLRPTLVPSTNLGAENIGSLLDTLQCTMQAMKQDLKGSM